MESFLMEFWEDQAELKASRSNRSNQLPLPSQDRDPEVSGLYEITAKWLRTRVGSEPIQPYINTTLAHSRYADRHRHARRHRDRQINTLHCNMNRFACLQGFGSCFLFSRSACRRILAVVVRVQRHIPDLARSLPHTI